MFNCEAWSISREIAIRHFCREMWVDLRAHGSVIIIWTIAGVNSMRRRLDISIFTDKTV